MTSLKREIITKTPDIFKIQVLKEIKDLFPDSNALFAGFGNRPTVNYL